jgi:hypothetical protein
MRRRFPPDDRRSRDDFLADDLDQSRLRGRSSFHRRGRDHEDEDASGYDQPGGPPNQGRPPSQVPRYVPGAPPRIGADHRPVRGPMPARQPPMQPAQPIQPTRQGTSASGRTDPEMYQWDRLSREQQQAVLATIGHRGASQTARLRIVFLFALVLVLVVAILLVYLHTR